MKYNTLAVHLTELCNMQCEYCYLNSDRIKGRNTLQNIQNAIAKIKPNELFFYGGEATLAFSLMQEVVNLNSGLSFSIETNAKFLKQAHLEFFKKHNFRIFVSLDGLDVEGNAERGMNQEHIDRVLTLFKQSPNVSIVITTTNKSKNQDKLVEWIKQNAHSLNHNPYEMYPAVIPCEKLSDEIINKLEFYKREFAPLKIKCLPKWRVHVDGSISKSHKRGVDSWDLVPAVCRKCSKVNECIGLSVFPAMINDLANNGELENNFICKVSKIL